MKKDPLIGQSLANFFIDRPLGRGGMAQVYYGIDRQLERPVAVKVIDARYQGDPEYARRFVDEAKLVARWRHENIVHVYYAGVENDVYFFAMEYIDGASLEELLARYINEGALMPHEEVLRIGKAVASALDYAHKQGVVHRDVKPSNVMISRDERVVLMDFGLALDTAQGSMGQIFGTPHYISPEQARKSSDASNQSDIYSLGVVLYEMLTGSIPFDDESATSVAVQHITQAPPPPTLLNPALNQETEDVLLKALAKQPEERFKTATEMLNALETALSQVDESAILPPLAVTGKQLRLSQMSISDMLALDLDEDEKPTAKSMKAANPVHKLETQEAPASARKTKIAQENSTREVRAIPSQSQVSIPAEADAPNRNTGLIVAMGSAVIVVLIVILALLVMNLGNQNPEADITGSETALANLAATDGEDIFFETATPEPSIDVDGTATTIALTDIIVEPLTEMPSGTPDSSGTGTSVAATNEAVLLQNTNVAATNQAVQNAISQTETANAENIALASTNAVLETTLTAQAIPTQAPAAPTVLYPDGLLLEMTYNSAGFYLRNSSDTNIRLSSLRFVAVDSNGNTVGNNFDGVDWTRFYGNVDREGRCVVIELLDQAAWTRPTNCVAAGGGSVYNAQLTFPTNDLRIFWDGRNGAVQFALYQNGNEIGRCTIADGYCALRIAR